MRITLIGPVYPYRGGIAHHTTLLAQSLATRHEVQLISFRRLYPAWLYPGRNDRDPSLAPLRADAEYLLDPLDPVTWWRAAKRVSQFRAGLVILPWWVTFMAPAWLGLITLLRRLTRAKVLFLCHNVVPHEGGALQRSLARWTLARGDAAIVQSQGELATLARLTPHLAAAYSPHPTYAEIGRTSAGRDAPRGHSETPVILYFGFIRPYKGLHVLLDAMPAVLAVVPARLVIVGEVWGSRAEYDAQIARLSIGEHVTLVDEYVPNERLADYFGEADVVVLPYLSATQSGVAQLAFGFGVPVIASHVGGLPEIVQHGRTGLLVPPGDPIALADAIIRYFREGLRAPMQASIRSDEGRFSWMRMVETVEMVAAGLA